MAIECKNLEKGLRLATNGTFFACCHTFNAPFRNEEGELLRAGEYSIDDALNSHTRQTMLKEFKNDIRSAACKVCWDAEDAGFESKRIRDNITFRETNRAIPTRKDDDIFFLELNLGNTCNLACRICHISASSKWRNDHKVLHPNYSEAELDAEVLEYSKAYLDDSSIWKYLKEILPKIQQLDIYGGEPMLMKKQWEILEFCVKEGYAHSQFMSFNTNGTIVTPKYIDILTSFHMSRIGFSLDGVGDRFHYLRYPGNWLTVNNNITKWLETREKIEKDPNKHNKLLLEIACTISALNVMYVFEMLDYALERDIKLFISFVYNPVYLSITNLPEDVKPKVLAYIEEELEKREVPYSKNRAKNDLQHARTLQSFNEVRKIITTLKLPNKSNPKEWRTFRKHTQLLDRSRKQDFKYTFPRAEELYKVYKLT